MHDDRARPAPVGDRRRDAAGASEALAEFVQECRTALGMSQSEAARKASISKSTWQNVESGGGRAMRHLTAHAIARALGIDPNLLLRLRDGVTTLDEVRQSTRSREDILTTIGQYATWLRVDDLLAVEEAARVRAELRRLQSTDSREVAEPEDR